MFLHLSVILFTEADTSPAMFTQNLNVKYEKVLTSPVCPWWVPCKAWGVNRPLHLVFKHEKLELEVWTDHTSCVMHGREQALTFCACAWGVWLWGVNRPYLLCHAWAWTGSYLLCLRMSSSSARREVPCLRPQVRNLRAESMFLPMIISWNTSRMIPSSTESTMFYNYNI